MAPRCPPTCLNRAGGAHTRAASQVGSPLSETHCDSALKKMSQWPSIRSSAFIDFTRSFFTSCETQLIIILFPLVPGHCCTARGCPPAGRPCRSLTSALGREGGGSVPAARPQESRKRCSVTSITSLQINHYHAYLICYEKRNYKK